MTVNRVRGRNIYIVDLPSIARLAGGPASFARLCVESKFTAVWPRLGEAWTIDTNFTHATYSEIARQLRAAGVEIWGYHKPRCPTRTDASREAQAVCAWIAQYSLDGVVLDAERDKKARFLGGLDEATIYGKEIKANSATSGIALSSHDQPSLHTDLPIGIFLKYAYDNCPQVYYQTDVASRLEASVRDYSRLEGQAFAERYKPVGNITVRSDVKLPDARTCVKEAGEFIRLVKEKGLAGYGFWCWDDAPPEIFDFFKNTPVFG
jgi:hypothetical protein